MGNPYTNTTKGPNFGYFKQKWENGDVDVSLAKNKIEQESLDLFGYPI